MRVAEFRHATALALSLLLAACGGDQQDAAPSRARSAAGPELIPVADADWARHGNGYGEERFSPLNQINADNVDQLGLAWYLDLDTNRGQEATPIVIDGVIYISTAWSKVFALDAVSGRELWRFDPQVDRSRAALGCCGPVSRGVAVENGKVFLATYDGRLMALDAASGKVLWQELTIDLSKPYTITGAPRVVENRVIIGNGGAEFGVRGYVSAYDADSGELAWRFYTVPGDPSRPFENPILEKAAQTWTGEWWEIGGGGTAWDSFAYDPELGLLYIGVGNGSPWNPAVRSPGGGDNLFLSSIVAVKAATGEYAWHYQTTPGDAWDYTATQHLILTDLEIDGQTRKVILQAPKNGFFYVLDRETGEFLSGEPFIGINWASHIDPESGRPVVNPEAEYWKTGQPALVIPGFYGAHNWHPMSYSPDTGLVYIPALELGYPYAAEPEFELRQQAPNLGVDLAVGTLPDDPAVIQAFKDQTRGHLAAWDPVARKEVWRHQYAGPWNGGALSTGGNLVFQGSAAGFFHAFDATSGKALWEFPAQTGIVAAPSAFARDGVQYVAVMAGWGGTFPLLMGDLALVSGEVINRSRLLVFKLGGEVELPAPDMSRSQMADLSEVELDPAVVAQGAATYTNYCVGCHGSRAVGGGVVPDLRYSAFLQVPDGWLNVVIGGALKDRGMAAFDGVLNESDAEAIRAYVIDRNQYAQRTGDTSRLGR